ncbi:isochorismate synthase MenF [Ferrimonas balearica]|uniref:isochorismate synthase n=1 Tax=Ferrimonas balearica TaxID=44012 RepID=UPI001C99615F|nr:isochorismate synthase [Ferrimonas balearica]MBY5994171.1 isochorismate synthase [Ferrimonas balearica]
MTQLEQQPPAHLCLQLSEPLDPPPLIAWLANQQLLPRLYWRGRRNGEEIATVGAALDLHFPEMPNAEELDRIYHKYLGAAQDTQLRLYGGMAFDSQQSPWPDFGQARFVLPRVEIRRHGDQAQLMLNLCGQERPWAQELARARAALDALQPAAPLSPLGPAHVLARQDTPDQPRWRELITHITDPAFIRETPKVVMARESRLATSALPNHWTVLHAWQLLNPGSYQFGFQFSDHHSFISCSPERLFHRLGRELSTEALAGTTVRGFNEAEDQALASALLADGKNSHENLLVRQHIEQQLVPLSDYVGAEESPTILKLNHIQHLHRAIRAELKAGVNDLQLLGALHPTPAVGGLPRAAAMNYIRQREGFSRGWYAGACGFFGAHESEFAVAIRSARFEAERVTLFAGAGIVADSEADAEWQELNNKLTTVLGILNGL